MSKTRAFVLWAVAVLAVGCQQPNGGRIELKVKYPPGTYQTTMAMDSTTAMTMADLGQEPRLVSMSMLMEMRMVYGRPGADGRQEVTMTYTRIRQSTQAGGREMLYDSNNPEEQSSPLAPMYKPMLGAQFVAVIDADGKLVSLKGVDELFEKMAKENPAIAPLMNQFKKSLNMRELFDLGSKFLPAQPVAIGETFEKQADLPVPMFGTLAITYHGRLLSVQKTPAGRIAIIDFSGKAVKAPAASQPAASSPAASEPGEPTSPFEQARLTLNQTGQQIFNVDKGMVQEATMIQAADVESPITAGDRQGTMTMSMKQTVKLTTTEVSP